MLEGINLASYGILSFGTISARMFTISNRNDYVKKLILDIFEHMYLYQLIEDYSEGSLRRKSYSIMKRRLISMMQTPLLLSSFIKRAEQFFPNKLIISRTGENSIHRIPYQ